jgi:hypothetical protein
MTDRSPSPFAGLDKALLRSTQQLPSRSDEPAREPEPLPLPPRSPRPASKPPKPPKASSGDSGADSVSASVLASYQLNVIESIRKVVKVPGKEVSFVRLTAEEKAHLADIVYTYKRLGKKTSENEINRIAVNFILEDYRANGEESILAKVIAALLA